MIQLFDSHTWRALLRAFKPQVVYDIGANEGHFSQVAIECGCQALAFEPQPCFHAQLARLGAGPVKLALWDAAGPGVLHVPADRGLATLGRPGWAEWTDLPVQLQDLDHMLLPRPDFIKLDVEGAELKVLQGGRQLLASCQPPVLCEYAEQNTRQFGYEPAEIDELMFDLGYCWLDAPPWDRLYVAF